MKFKHTLHVFVDNFSTTYKLLLYRIVILVLFACIYSAIVYPFITKITGATQFAGLKEAVNALFIAISDLDLSELGEALPPLKQAVQTFLEFLSTKTGEFAAAVVILTIVYLIQKFLHGLGNYTTGALLNDKMALQANSSFIGTMIKNLGKASLYNVIYVPLSVLYNVVCVAIVYLLFFKALGFIPIVFEIFLFATVIVVLIVVKMTFTTDWLPSLIYGKTNNRQAMAYSFSRKNKKTASVFSNFLILILIILALNVAAIFFTFGAGVLITIPASYILLIAFEFVNYCDNNDLSYFIDKNTVVKPEKQPTPSREEFFRGDR